MTKRETGELWSLPGLPWADFQTTSVHKAGTIGIDGHKHEVYEYWPKYGHCIFVEAENAFCELTVAGEKLFLQQREHWESSYSAADYYEDYADDIGTQSWWDEQEEKRRHDCPQAFPQPKSKGPRPSSEALAEDKLYGRTEPFRASRKMPRTDAAARIKRSQKDKRRDIKRRRARKERQKMRQQS